MSNIAIVFRNGNGRTAHLSQAVVDGAARSLA